MGLIKIGVNVSLDEIAADEAQAMLIIVQERNLLEREHMPNKYTP
jgi:hypothetical protein